MFNIAICDDEIKEAEAIEIMLEEFMKKNTVIYKISIFNSGEELIASLEKFDFVILDILMRGMNGIETGMKLYQRNRQIKLIYITNYNEYCNEAVNNVHAFAYLLKPIRKEQLIKQIKELIKLIGIDKGKNSEIELSNVTEVKGEERKACLKVKIPVADILYFEYVKASRKIKIITKKKTYEYIGTMADMEQKMDVYGFGICYRGILVNFSHVIKAKGNKVFLNNGEMLPLSQKRVGEFKEQLSHYVRGI